MAQSDFKWWAGPVPSVFALGRYSKLPGGTGQIITLQLPTKKRQLAGFARSLARHRARNENTPSDNTSASRVGKVRLDSATGPNFVSFERQSAAVPLPVIDATAAEGGHVQNERVPEAGRLVPESDSVGPPASAQGPAKPFSCRNLEKWNPWPLTCV
jgi:hypothetical protein